MKKALIVANTLGLVEAFLGVDIETLENLGYISHATPRSLTPHMKTGGSCIRKSLFTMLISLFAI